MRKNKVNKMMTILAAVFVTIGVGKSAESGVKLQDIKTVKKFFDRNNCETSYLAKENFLGHDKLIRCRVKQGEVIKVFYDNTFFAKEKYLIEKACDNFNEIFETINPNYIIKAYEKSNIITTKLPKKRNEICLTKTNIDREGVTGSKYSWDVPSLSGDFVRLQQKIIFNSQYFTKDVNRESEKFYSVLCHELLHCFGLGDAYLMCDKKTLIELTDSYATIMRSGFSFGTFIGSNDYNLLCGLYGEYDEDSLYKYDEKIEIYKKIVKNSRETYLIEQNKELEIAKEIVKNTTNKGEKDYDIKEYVDIFEPIYLKDSNQNNFYKIDVNQTYDFFNGKDKTIKTFPYSDNYYLTKLSEDKCLMQVGENYLICDTFTNKVTNKLYEITQEQYNTAVGVKTPATAPDLCL